MTDIFPNKNQCLYCSHKFVISPNGYFHTSHFYCNVFSVRCIDLFYLKEGNCKYFSMEPKKQ